MDTTQILQAVAQYGGWPGLLILYFIMSHQRNQDRSEKEGQESAMATKLKNFEDQIQAFKNERREDEERHNTRFKEIENKVDSNYRELSAKLDRIIEGTNSGLSSIKDMLANMGKDIAVLNDRKDRESK